MEDFIKQDTLGAAGQSATNLNLPEHVIAIVRLQDGMVHMADRLDTIENNVSNFEDSINRRFDKFEIDAADRRRDILDSFKDVKETQRELKITLQSVLEQAKKTNGRVNRLEEMRDLDEEACDICKNDLDKLKSFRLKVYGAIALGAFLLSVYGVSLLGIFRH